MTERVPVGWRVGFAVAVALTTASFVTTAGITGLSMRPHAFGGRDGQGAAGLAALIFLGGAVASLTSLAGLVVVTAKLRRRFVAGWAWPVALGVPATLGALAAVLTRFSR